MGIIIIFLGISKKNYAQKNEHNLLKPSIHAVSDSRLNEVSGQTRGCGGVAILWGERASIVHNIPCPGNGRLCCSYQTVVI